MARTTKKSKLPTAAEMTERVKNDARKGAAYWQDQLQRLDLTPEQRECYRGYVKEAQDVIANFVWKPRPSETWM